MIQIIHTTYLYIGDKKQHLITACDEKDNLIDMIEIKEQNGRVIECKSILK